MGRHQQPGDRVSGAGDLQIFRDPGRPSRGAPRGRVAEADALPRPQGLWDHPAEESGEEPRRDCGTAAVGTKGGGEGEEEGRRNRGREGGMDGRMDAWMDGWMDG